MTILITFRALEAPPVDWLPTDARRPRALASDTEEATDL